MSHMIKKRYLEVALPPSTCSTFLLWEERLFETLEAILQP